MIKYSFNYCEFLAYARMLKSLSVTTTSPDELDKFRISKITT